MVPTYSNLSNLEDLEAQKRRDWRTQTPKTRGAAGCDGYGRRDATEAVESAHGEQLGPHRLGHGALTAQSRPRPFGLLVFRVWSISSHNSFSFPGLVVLLGHDPERLFFFYFQVLWASEYWVTDL